MSVYETEGMAAAADWVWFCIGCNASGGDTFVGCAPGRVTTRVGAGLYFCGQFILECTVGQ